MSKTYRLGPLLSLRKFPDNYHEMSKEDKINCDIEWDNSLKNKNIIHKNMYYYREVIFDDFGKELPDDFNLEKKDYCVL